MSTLLHEFQVVIFAGGEGRLLKPLTDDKPKCLLPVANRPLLSYQLEFLSKTGFKEVIIITTGTYEDDISSVISQLRQEFPDLTEVVVRLEIVEDYLGTAAALLHIKPILKRHVIVMSGDLIVENNFFLHHMADLHRANDAAATMLVYSLPPPEEKSKKQEKQHLEYIAIHENRLVFCESTKNVDDDKPLKMPKSILKRFPNFVLHTDLRDAHFYILSNWTLDILEQNKQMIQSLRGDFLPYLAKLQSRKKKTGIPNPPSFLSPDSYLMSSSLSVDVNDKIKCFAWKLDKKAYCVRVNTVENYMEANRAVATGNLKYLPLEPESTSKHKHFIALTAEVHEKTQIPSECIVGAFTTIGERVGVKKSIIGKHCKIADSAKILNSVVMDHVSIGDGSVIQNCIVGPNSYIDPQSKLTDCQLGSGCRVEAEMKAWSDDFMRTT